MYLSSQFLFSFHHLSLNLENDDCELSLQEGKEGGEGGCKLFNDLRLSGPVNPWSIYCHSNN